MPEKTNQTNPAENVISQEYKGKILLRIARAEISDALGKQAESTDENQPWLHDPGASFVTLTINQHLRGCIGSLEAHRPLLIDVKANAYAAAFRDPRFSPLTIAELDTTEIEISLLSPQHPLFFKDEADALAQLKPNIDGVVFKYGRYRSTFLPQVWGQLTDAKTFMAHLKHKAGLDPRFWNDDIELYRYTATKFKEKDLHEALSRNTESIAS
ncbi:MAG TPA: AmmeMemoRadiSam system protein A [Methylotenera sp.]